MKVDISFPLVILCSIKNVQSNCIPSDVYYYFPESNMLFICTVFMMINVVIHIICMLLNDV